MAREDRYEKAGRLLREQRLHVSLVTGERVAATCRGDSGAYALGHDGRGWFCGCPAYGQGCSHLIALILVTVPASSPASGTVKA